MKRWYSLNNVGASEEVLLRSPDRKEELLIISTELLQSCGSWLECCGMYYASSSQK